MRCDALRFATARRRIRCTAQSVRNHTLSSPVKLSLSEPSGRRRSIGLQSLLTAVPVLVILPLVVFAATLLYLLAERNARDARYELEQANRALAAGVDRELTNSIRMLQLMAQAPNLEADSLAVFERFARNAIDAGLGWQSVILIDRQGMRLLPRVDQPDEQAKRVMLAHHEQVFDTGQPLVSNLHPSAVDGKLSVSVSVPVVRDGGVRWVLSARIDLNHLQKLLVSQKTQYASIATVMDGNRVIIARSQGMDRFFGRQPSRDTLAALAAGPSGMRQITTHEGASMLWSWTTLPHGWTVFLGAPVELHDASLRASMRKLAIAGLVALAIGVLMAVMIARLIARAVNVMAENAPSLVSGATPAYQPCGIRQLDALYEALESASSRLASALRERAEALAAEKAARAEAERANRAKDEFLSMLAHELRNPLAPVVNAHAILRRFEALSGQGVAMLAMAERQMGQMKRLVDDLLEVTRITQGKIALKPRTLCVATAIHNAVQSVCAAHVHSGRHISIRVSDKVGSIVADETRVAQVLENLLGNAVKYTRGDDAIRIEAEGDADAVRIRVIDEGMGIDADNLTMIFDLFAQAEVALDRSQGGLGIGLAMVKRLVELHGGMVSAASAGKGHGATFTIVLPRRCVAVPQTEEAVA